MRREISFEDGYILTVSEKGYDHVVELVEKGMFWEYISSLIEQDVRNRDDSQTELLKQLESSLKDLSQKFDKSIAGVLQSVVATQMEVKLIGGSGKLSGTSAKVGEADPKSETLEEPETKPAMVIKELPPTKIRKGLSDLMQNMKAQSK